VRTSDELAQSRRRTKDTRATEAATHQAPTSAVSSEFYRVVSGGGDFPTTGLNTVFEIQLLNDVPAIGDEGSIVEDISAGGEIFLALNLGEGIPIPNVTVVRCDQFDGQLFFTYRGNGSAT
jgi:hypothetical protein